MGLLPSINTITVVSLTFKAREGTDTITVHCSNRPSTASSADIYPILQSVNGIGANMGEWLPQDSRGNIILTNSVHSLGSERKISDLLDRYYLQGTEVLIRTIANQVGIEITDPSSITEIWKAKIVSVNFTDQTMSVTFGTTFIPARTVNYIVDLDAFPSAPDSSLGKFLPVIFGENIEVEPVLTSRSTSGGANRYEYAYATTMGAGYRPGGALSTNVKVLHENSITEQFEEVKFASSATTPIYSSPFVEAIALKEIRELVEVAYKLTPDVEVTGGELITSVDWFVAYHNAGGATFNEGNYSVNVYRDSGGQPGLEIGKATINLNDPNFVIDEGTFSGAVGTVHRYRLRFFFSQAIQIPHSESIYIGLSQNDKQEIFLPLVTDYSFISSEEVLKWRKSIGFVDFSSEESIANETEFLPILSQQTDSFQVYSVAGTVDNDGGPTNLYQDGLGRSTVTLLNRDQDFLPDLSRAKFVLSVSGMRDTGTGSITGTPNARLVKPIHVISFLLLKWNGTAWAGGLFDSSPFSNTHSAINDDAGRYKIRIGGATQGRLTLEQLLGEVCSNSMAQLIPRANGQLALYHYGTTQSVQAILEDEEIKFISASEDGFESVVNDIKAVYNRGVISNTESLLADGSLQSYKAFFNSSRAIVSASSNESKASFGVRENGVAQYDFIQDATSMRSICTILLNTFSFPKRSFELEHPYFMNTGLSINQVIDVYSVGMPHHFGATQEARSPVASDGTTLVDPNMGLPIKRQKKYRCKIESYRIELGKGTVPMIRYGLHVINKGAEL